MTNVAVTLAAPQCGSDTITGTVHNEWVHDLTLFISDGTPTPVAVAVPAGATLPLSFRQARQTDTWHVNGTFSWVDSDGHYQQVAAHVLGQVDWTFSETTCPTQPTTTTVAPTTTTTPPKPTPPPTTTTFVMCAIDGKPIDCNSIPARPVFTPTTSTTVHLIPATSVVPPNPTLPVTGFPTGPFAVGGAFIIAIGCCMALPKVLQRRRNRRAQRKLAELLGD